MRGDNIITISNPLGLQNTALKSANICKQFVWSGDTIVQWTRGTIEPTDEEITMVAEYLGTTYEYLTDRTPLTLDSEEDEDYMPEVYFNFAKNARVRKLDPRDIEMIMDTLERMRNKPEDDKSDK